MTNHRDTELDDVVREFLSESKENLELFEATLLEAESDPSSNKPLAALFRSIHSIKGSCGFLGLTRLESIVHAGETLLGKLRDGHLPLDAQMATALLDMVDVVRRLLSNIQETGAEGDLDFSSTLARLESVIARSNPSSATPESIASAAVSDADLAPVVNRADSKIRVDVALLDRLVNLVGELVLCRNQVLQFSAAQPNSGILASAQTLSLVTTELQEAVMKTRMQPIGNIWNRFPRVVRDLARATSKAVRIEMVGTDTELDKSIIEAIQDPLLHLVRNAVDHGVEPSSARATRGKAAEATLLLRAFHEGGMVNIEISDDGGGIDVGAVKHKALRMNLVSADQVARMSDREALSLIFLPGFTTAEKVTTVSGRGVGMDVVRTNVEKIGGTVDIQTTPGKGTTVKIKIPLTLAIIPALVVTSGGRRYAIPQASLLEVVRLEGERKKEIETVQGAPVFRLRGKLLPIAYLNRELGGETSVGADDAIAVVVLQADDRSFGLVVDDIRDTEEIVVKPLWKRLKGIPCYAGATVMGDGEVALILDAIGMAQRVGVVSESRERNVVHRVAATPQAEAKEELVLLCRHGIDGRLAIPLSMVARLENFAYERIEHVGGSDVAQYRDEILPLVHVAKALEERRSRPRESTSLLPADHERSKQVVVAEHDGHRVGLVVDAILDIVSVETVLQKRSNRAGVLGSMVVQGRITEFLDVDHVIRAAAPVRETRRVSEAVELRS